MGKTGVIGAMEPEIALLLEAAQIERTMKRAGMEFHEGTLGQHDLVIVQCGMGKVNAGICAQILVDEFHVTQIINTGVAGSLDERLHIGDIVVSTDAVQHDYDVSPIGFARGEIPYSGMVAFPADHELSGAAFQAARAFSDEINVVRGRICSGDQFIAKEEERRRIVDEFRGYCCEMEGAAIAQVCHLNQVPFVILRAISDSADDEGGSSFEEFMEDAAKHCSAIVKTMLEERYFQQDESQGEMSKVRCSRRN